MEPLEVIIFEFLLGYALQGFSIVLGAFAFNRRKIVFKKYILASSLVTIISYLVRLLPISFGVHTILNMLFMFLICVIVLRIPAYSTIRSALIITVLLLICEMADVAVMISFLGKARFENLMLDSLNKAIIGLPGTVLFVLLVTSAYFYFNYQTKKKGEYIGNLSEKHS
jgi:hypothetical protein